ncbi:hypothetical protein JCM1840_007307 [Sporobolomyces johnsonii]
MRLALLSALLLPALVVAQLTTITDDAGDTIAASIVTDADGDPSETVVISTISSATTTATTATTATTTEAVGQPAVVGQPVSSCTTAGCPVEPTTYTQNGVIVTWTATTPTTPIPTWTSSGGIQQLASYITTVSSASGLSGAAPAFRIPLGTLGDWGVMAGVAVVGGLVGAVAVL